MRNRVVFKAEARRRIHEGHVSPILATAAVLAACFLLDRLVDLAEGGNPFATYQYNMSYFRAVASGDVDSIQAVLDMAPQATAVSLSLTIAAALFTTVLNGGYYLFCMGILRGEDTPMGVLLDGLGSAGRLIWCSIQLGVRIFLWSLLIAFPGSILLVLMFTPLGGILFSILLLALVFVTIYRYRFAVYNVLRDPELSAGQAIALSCEQTKGMKWELFVLDLSFIGWSLLSALTLGLLELWVMPYRVLCDLMYFEDARQRMGGGENWM